MKVISHRGLWKSSPEKNTESAFERSFSLGFGTETDIRDKSGELVISHDMPMKDAISFEHFLKIALKSKKNGNLTLALNVKADGLASPIFNAIEKYSQLDYFAFDMAIPDMREYLKIGMPVFTRMSEVEMSPVWLDRAAGVWLDGFESEWHDNKLIEDLLGLNKRVCVVSSELHHRCHKELWHRLQSIKHKGLMLCTDFPEEAASYFNSKT